MHFEKNDHIPFSLTISCCGKPKLEMSPLRKQGSTAKKLDSCPFGFAQGRLFAGMINAVSATGTKYIRLIKNWLTFTLLPC